MDITLSADTIHQYTNKYTNLGQVVSWKRPLQRWEETLEQVHEYYIKCTYKDTSTRTSSRTLARLSALIPTARKKFGAKEVWDMWSTLGALK